MHADGLVTGRPDPVVVVPLKARLSAEAERVRKQRLLAEELPSGRPFSSGFWTWFRGLSLHVDEEHHKWLDKLAAEVVLKKEFPSTASKRRTAVLRARRFVSLSGEAP